MKNFGIKILLSALLLLGFHNQIAAQGTPSDGNNILSEYNQYLKAVNLDEGKILNKNLLNNFLQIATKDNWYSEIKFWVSAQWGMKESKGVIAKQYELMGNDLVTSVIDKRPKKIMDGDLYGVEYDGTGNYNENSDFKAQHPLSVLIVFKADKNANENVLFDTKGDKTNQISIAANNNGESELVIRSSGELRLKGIKDGINVVYIEYNIKSSNVYINGDLAYSGVIGKSEFDGIVIGKGKNRDKVDYLKGTMYECGIINDIITAEARTSLINFMKDQYHVN